MYSSYVEGFWSPFSQEFYRIFWEQKSIELSAKRRVASHLGTFDRNRDFWSHAKQRKGLELVKCCLLDFVNLDHLHIFCEVDLPNAQSSGLQANQALYCWSTVDIYFLKIKSQIGAMAKCTFSSSFSSTLSSSWFLSKWLLSTNFRPFRNLTLAPGGKSFPTECNTIVTISEFWEYRQVSDIVVRTGLKRNKENFQPIRFYLSRKSSGLARVPVEPRLIEAIDPKEELIGDLTFLLITGSDRGTIMRFRKISSKD